MTLNKGPLGQLTINDPCHKLAGVGPRLQELLEKKGITSIMDLLFHLPIRYQDRTRITPIAQLRPGDHVLVEGYIESSQIQLGKRRSLLIKLSDGSGTLSLRFFHFTTSQRNQLLPDTKLRCYGEVRGNQFTGLAMFHPEYRKVQDKEDDNCFVEDTLTPIYSTTEGLQQTRIRKLIVQALQILQRQLVGVKELLPETVLKHYDFPSLGGALLFIHNPPPDVKLASLEAGEHPAQRRLVLEELLAHQLSLRRLRLMMQQHPAPVFSQQQTLQLQFLQQLPFALTSAQQRVSDEIAKDLQQCYPMMRLVQGDVGSGKTVVAALAVIQAVQSNKQAAMMAPTEILAEQHFQNFKLWLEPLGVKVAWLSGKQKTKVRREMLQLIKDGEAKVIVGTHAIFQHDVDFADLGLMVVDEQHRFGVHQRLALREKGMVNGVYPHQLIMTATPIPRTLAMTAYADLDYSVIDELPPGRTPVTTVAISQKKRQQVIQRVQEVCAQGRQVYWVCTLIEESEVLQCEAAEDTAQVLQAALTNLKVGLIHGRMKDDVKQQIMSLFKQGELDLLVATTVIEVGVDVPNASLMIIENPERLGLAQLHQLRGRVGRGSIKSHCALLYQTPLSQQSRARIDIMRQTSDGFEIAQRDLELRGPGEVLGTRQTGLMQLRIADILRDKPLLPEVQQLAEHVVTNHPEDIEPLIKRWLGCSERYGEIA